MTVEELLNHLRAMPPYLVVRLWDSKHERFTERLTLELATIDDELLIVPRDASYPSQRKPASARELFDFSNPPAGQPSSGASHGRGAG